MNREQDGGGCLMWDLDGPQWGGRGWSLVRRRSGRKERNSMGLEEWCGGSPNSGISGEDQGALVGIRSGEGVFPAKMWLLLQSSRSLRNVLNLTLMILSSSRLVLSLNLSYQVTGRYNVFFIREPSRDRILDNNSMYLLSLCWMIISIHFLVQSFEMLDHS